MYRVYILQCLKDTKYYIGYSSNLDERINAHNRGSVKSTKNRRPFKLVYYEEFSTRQEAMLREKQIKSYKGGLAFKHLVKNIV